MRALALAAVTLFIAGCEGLAGQLGDAEHLPTGVSTHAPLIDSFGCTPAAVQVGDTVTCAASVRDPNGRPLTCSLSVSDGRTLAQGVDCGGLSRDLTFPMASVAQVKLLASNDLGVSSEQTVSVTVTGRPNQSPVIASFTASPAAGTAPFGTTLAWQASDPDGDALTCDLDVGADGSVEYPGLDCALGVQTYSMTQIATVPVQLTVSDGHGGTTTAQLSLTGKMAVGDVQLASADWGQTIVSATPRLVGLKAALLRAHVLGSKAGLTGVVVQAEGFSSTGASLGMLTMTGPASPPTADAPNDLSKQYVATVPGEWVKDGFSVAIHVDPADALPETDETNNDLTVTPSVGAANVLKLTAVPVVLDGNTANTLDLRETMTRIWPLQAVDSQTRAPFNGGSIPGNTDVNAWGNLLQDLASARSADGSSRDYYGFLALNYQAGIAGLGYIGQGAAIGRDDSDETAAHELGHNMGRQHAPCGGASGADPQYPYANADIGKLGYDYVSNRLAQPGQNVDLMSYCQPVWVSDFNYGHVQQELESGAYLFTGVGMYAPRDAWLVRGQIDVDGAVTLRPVMLMHAAITADANDAVWTVAMTFGDRVEEHPVQVFEAPDADGARHFQALIPDQGGLSAVTVKYLGARVASVPVGPARSAVARVIVDDATSTARVEWDSALWPVAGVAHFGADGVRTTLALELRGGEARIALGQLRGGSFEVSLAGPLGAARLVMP
ncbi:MAG: M66 family metalloprotease [Myxococcaceae bacterium]